MRVLLTTTLFAVGGLHSAAQVASCHIKLGGVYFKDCPVILASHDVDVFACAGWQNGLAQVDLSIFSEAGVLEARIEGGKLIGGDTHLFLIVAGADEWTVLRSGTGRMICRVQRAKPDKPAAGCQINAWLNVWMPGGLFFSGDAERSNQAALQGAQGATMERARKAFNFQ